MTEGRYENCDLLFFFRLAKTVQHAAPAMHTTQLSDKCWHEYKSRSLAINAEQAQRDETYRTTIYIYFDIWISFFLPKFRRHSWCAYLDKHRVNAGDLRVHVLFQVFVEELKDEVKLVLGVHNFVKPAQC